MTTLSDLARARVNIIGIYPAETGGTVAFEYQYRPADGTPRTWHKGAFYMRDVTVESSVYSAVLAAVRASKRELE